MYVSYGGWMSIEPLPESGLTDLGITDARDNLAELVNEAAYTGSIRYITRRGRRVAAIVSAEDTERLERDEDAYLVRLADQALAEVQAGAPMVSFDQLRAQLATGR